MELQDRRRVHGRCRQSLEEDLCSVIELPVRTVVFCPVDSFIHVELRECSEISCELIKNWQLLDISHNGKLFLFERLIFASAPREAYQFGFSFAVGVSVAVRFIAFDRMN